MSETVPPMERSVTEAPLPAVPDRPNVLLVMIDALRADRVIGGDRSCQTPFLDGLRAQSTAFTNAFSTASTTPICTASILTGTYPFTHGVRSLLNCRLRDDLQTLPEAFRDAGYRTWAEVTGPLLALTDMDRGFDEYRCRPRTEWLDTDFAPVLERRLQEPGPWFGFVHFFEIHHPRRVVDGFGGREYGHTVYDRAVSSLDSQLAQVLTEIPDDLIVVFTADHGEHVSASAGDVLGRLKRLFRLAKRSIPGARRFRRSSPTVFRAIDRLSRRDDSLYLDWVGHGYHVYDYLTRVPLFFRGSVFPPGLEVSKLASHVDLLPTLATACDLRIRDPSSLHGRDLTTMLNGATPPNDRPLYLEACGVQTESRPERRVSGLRTSEYKYATRPLATDHREELFDLRSDPHERRNVAHEAPDVLKAMRTDLIALMEQAPQAGTAQPYSKEELALVEDRLRDLGYLD